LPKPKKKRVQREDKRREERIIMEIVVDCYDSDERAMGWHCYMEENLQFPFKAICIEDREVSPLSIDDKVDVVGMADDRECRAEVFVLIEWDGDELAVPLSQLKPGRGTDPKTKDAVEDWHYWTEMGYQY
jgi:hypothetical protein